jgi:uncharacterized protein YggT (Ycf19 family)
MPPENARLLTMEDEKLALDEARRMAQRDAVRENVERNVNREIIERAELAQPSPPREVDRLASELKANVAHEVVETEREVKRARIVARISQVIDYIFYLIYGLLALRFLLALLAARPSAEFVQFIRRVTEPLYAPFRGIVARPVFEGGYTVDLPVVLAMVVYALLHLAIKGLLRLLAHRRTEV